MSDRHRAPGANHGFGNKNYQGAVEMKEDSQPMRLSKRTSKRTETLWRRVMREGHTLDQVAVESRMKPARLERLLIAMGKRRAMALKS
jgi:hypothetical protein